MKTHKEGQIGPLALNLTSSTAAGRASEMLTGCERACLSVCEITVSFGLLCGPAPRLGRLCGQPFTVPSVRLNSR